MRHARHSRSAPLLVAALILVAGCGSSVVTENQTGGTGGTTGAGGHSGAGGSAPSDCHVDPAGSTFVFHVHNAGTEALHLSYACGTLPSIVLATPGGMQSIQPFDVNVCGFTCEQQYKGPLQEACSDCGPGYGADLPPGATVDVQWDRRVYVEQTADPQCVGGMTGIQCALGIAVAPTAMQAGVLSVCPGGFNPPNSGVANCGDAAVSVSFTVDTTQSEATIDVQ